MGANDSPETGRDLGDLGGRRRALHLTQEQPPRLGGVSTNMVRLLEAGYRPKSGTLGRLDRVLELLEDEDTGRLVGHDPSTAQ